MRSIMIVGAGPLEKALIKQKILECKINPAQVEFVENVPHVSPQNLLEDLYPIAYPEISYSCLPTKKLDNSEEKWFLKHFQNLQMKLPKGFRNVQKILHIRNQLRR